MKQPTSITTFPHQQAEKSPQNQHVLSFNPLFVANKEKTPEPGQVPGSGGGGWGIRTPEGLHPTRFPSVRHRPLGESSVHIVPDNHKRKKPPSANPGQWTRSQARSPAKNRAPRQAGKQANRQTGKQANRQTGKHTPIPSSGHPGNSVASKPRARASSTTACLAAPAKADPQGGPGLVRIRRARAGRSRGQRRRGCRRRRGRRWPRASRCARGGTAPESER